MIYNNIVANFAESAQKEGQPSDCKGLFWRASVSSYVSIHKSIEVRKSLRLLKKKSCPGCDKCSWILDFFDEDIPCCSQKDDYLADIEHGKLYTFHVNITCGFEDVYPEVDGIEFVEVKE